MNKGSGIHTLGRGNLSNINAKYPLHKPISSSKSSVECDNIDGDESHAAAATATAAAAVENKAGDSKYGAKSSEIIGRRSNKQENDGYKTDSFHALITKFERKESTLMTLAKRKENDAVVAMDVGGNTLESSGVAKYTGNQNLSITNPSLEGKTNTDVIVLDSSENDTNPSVDAANNHVGGIVVSNSQTLEGVVHGKKNSFNVLLSKFEKKGDKLHETASTLQLPLPEKVAKRAGDVGSAPESTAQLYTDAEDTATPTNCNNDANEAKSTSIAKSSSKVKIPSFLKSRSKTKSVVAPGSSQPKKTQLEVFSHPQPTSDKAETPLSTEIQTNIFLTSPLLSNDSNPTTSVVGEDTRGTKIFCERASDFIVAYGGSPVAPSSSSARDMTSNSHFKESGGDQEQMRGIGKNKAFNELVSKFERNEKPHQKSFQQVEENGASGVLSATPPKNDVEGIAIPTSPSDGANNKDDITAVAKSPSRVEIPLFLKSKSKSESVVASETYQTEKSQSSVFSPQLLSSENDTDAGKPAKSIRVSAHMSDQEEKIKSTSLNALISKFEGKGSERHSSSTQQQQQQEENDPEGAVIASPDPNETDNASATPLVHSIKTQSSIFSRTQNSDGGTTAPVVDAVEILRNVKLLEIAVCKDVVHANSVTKRSVNTLVSKFERKKETQIVTAPQQQAIEVKSNDRSEPEYTGNSESSNLLHELKSETEGLTSRSNRNDATDGNREPVTKSSFSIKIPSFLKTRSKSEPTVPLSQTNQPLTNGNSASDENRQLENCGIAAISGSAIAAKFGSHESKLSPSHSLEHASRAGKTDAKNSPKQIPSLTPPIKTKKITSLLLSRSKSESQVPVSQPGGTVKNKLHVRQGDPKYKKPRNSSQRSSSLRKEQQSMKSHSKINSRSYAHVHQKSKPQARPSPMINTTSQTRMSVLKPPDLNLHSISHKSGTASISLRYNMVSPKSHQRLMLEQMAAQYFLNNPKLSSAKYFGMSSYADGDVALRKGGRGLGNIDENFDFIAQSTRGALVNESAKKAREELISFLEGIVRSATDDNNIPLEAPNSSMNTYGTTSELSSSNSRSDADKSQGSMMETNIDFIFEIANEHLSLGRNDLALQAYCRAMKIALADVLSVKKMSVKLKQKQGDSSPSDHIKQQEQLLESSLLQVASRVADVHNNMGVVYEMNYQFEAARTSYIDALEVYQNTCKRIDEHGGPDFDRTKKNIERMELACSSEKQRKALHTKSSSMSKKLEQEVNSTTRRSLLIEAVDTLSKALDLESNTVGSTHPVTASTLIQLGKYHYAMRDFDSAVIKIRQATKILRSALGENHPQVGKSTLLLASIYERHGVHVSPKGIIKDDLELELYVDALGPLKATLGEVNTEIGLLYEKIGHMYGKKGDLSLSLLAYKASLKAYGEPTLSANNGVQLEVVSIWLRVTEISTCLKTWEEVLISGHRALFLLRHLKNSLFQTAQLEKSSTGGSESSCRHISATPIASLSSKVSDIRITADTYYESLFNTLQSLGQAHTSLTHYSLAHDACLESLLLAWEMALSNSDTNAILRVIRALKRLGKVLLLDKHYSLALQYFLPCLELLRSSEGTESSMDCASVLGSIGYLYLKLSKFTESSNFLRQCLRLHQDNGAESSDREMRKVQAWLQLAESREGEVSIVPIGRIISEIR